MGGERVTVENLRVVKIDTERQVIIVEGSIPGSCGGLVYITTAKKKMNKKQKRDGITQFVVNRQGKLDVPSLGDCYRLFVDPGFVAKASHALRVCCPDRADVYGIACSRAWTNLISKSSLGLLERGLRRSGSILRGRV